jgi:hypothetical protein
MSKMNQILSALVELTTTYQADLDGKIAWVLANENPEEIAEASLRLEMRAKKNPQLARLWVTTEQQVADAAWKWAASRR